MALPRAVRALILAVVWTVVALHSGVCEAALAQFSSTAAHRCCGTFGDRSNQPAPLDCGDCAACATAGAPEVVHPTTPEALFLPPLFFTSLIPEPTAVSLTGPALRSVESDPPPPRVAVSCLTRSPNAPPVS